MSRQISNYQQQNLSLDTLGRMKDSALIATVAIAVGYVGKLAIESIREINRNSKQ